MLAKTSSSRTSCSMTRFKRRFDDAHTPLDRLLATSVVEASRREALLALRRQTNPRLLRQASRTNCGLFTYPGRSQVRPKTCIRPYASHSPYRKETTPW